MSGPVAWDLSAKTRIFLRPLRRLLVSGAPTNRIPTVGFFCRVKNIHISRIRA